LNVCSLRNKINELEAFLATLDLSIQIIVLAEHWLEQDMLSSCRIEGYMISSAYCRGNKEHGGIIICNTPETKCTSIDFISKQSIPYECEVVAVNVTSVNVILIGVYRPPDGNTDTFLGVMHNVLTYLNKAKHIIIVGDFNYCFIQQSSGCNNVCNFFSSFGFNFKNKDPTRLERCLDNVFINFTNDLLHCEVVQNTFSDHSALIFGYKSQKGKIKKTMKIIRPVTSTGISLINNILLSVDWSLLKDPNIDLNCRWKSFVDTIAGLSCECFPQKKVLAGPKVKNHTNWFSEDLKKMRDHLSLLNDLYHTSKNSAFLSQKKKARKMYRAALKKAKIDANDNFINSSDNPQRAMWSIINDRRKNCDKSPTSAVIEPKDFNKYFLNVANDIAGTTDVNLGCDNIICDSVQCDTFYFEICSPEEVAVCIGSLKNTKSSDYYGLNVKIIKSIATSIAPILSDLINECLYKGIFPNCLKLAVVVPLFKKGDINNKCNYRPISLLPIFSKIFEKIIKKRIVDFFERNYLFSNSQYGFRSKRNTGDAILDFVNFSLNCFQEGEFSVSSFLDLSKAFDCVNHSLLLHKLKMYNFSSIAIELVKSYLQDRFQAVRYKEEFSDFEEVTIGVPQGSVVGPILYIIFTNDLYTAFSHVKITGFADDNSIAVKGKDLKEVHKVNASVLEELTTWFRSNGLCLNNEKTKIMTLTLRDLSVFPNNYDHVTLLGVTIDEKLNWKAHCDNLVKKLNSSVFLLRSLASQVSMNVLLTAYYACFQSHIAYALLIWGHSPAAKKVFAVQRRVVRIMDNLSYREDCKGSFLSLKIHTLVSLYILSCVTYAHNNLDKFNKIKEGHSHYTRASESLAVKYNRTYVQRNVTNYWAVKLYNAIPDRYKVLAKQSFKSFMNTYLLTNAFYSVEEFLLRVKDL